MEWIILALVALLIFGGTAGARLAGLGKGAGRAIREFKEETQGLSDKEKAEKAKKDAQQAAPQVGTGNAAVNPSTEPVDAEVVEPSTPDTPAQS
jgi:sec-independent protein translocase protein TatA